MASIVPEPDDATVERFRSLVLPHLDAAFGYARWLTRNPTDAQDVAQEAILQALQYFHAFRGESARPWLLRIVRNTWLDFRRRNGAGESTLDDVEDLASKDPDPEQNALAGDRRRQVAAALAALPLEAREVMMLREIQGLSYNDIATLLDVPLGTVMSRLARARDRLAAGIRARLERKDHGLPDV